MNNMQDYPAPKSEVVPEVSNGRLRLWPCHGECPQAPAPVVRRELAESLEKPHRF